MTNMPARNISDTKTTQTLQFGNQLYTNMMRKDSKVKQKSVPRNYNKQLNFDTKVKNKVKEQQQFIYTKK